MMRFVGKDLEGLITSWNKGAEAMFGDPADEILGQPITRIIPPSRIEEETSILDRVRRGEQLVHFETERQCPGGDCRTDTAELTCLVACRGKEEYRDLAIKHVLRPP